MTEFFLSFDLSPLQWVLIILAAALIGANKTGLVSVSLLAVPLFAVVFGGKSSTGVLLPMLMIADLFAVFSFRRNVQWKQIFRLLPWVVVGIAIAMLVGNRVPDRVFRVFIALSLFVVLTFLIVKEITGREITVKGGLLSSAAIGLLGGFATMIGNAAGPVVSTYFISLDLDKNEFVATRAWFFWIVNVIKLPFHIFAWKTIDLRSLQFDVVLIPAIALGAFAGVLLVRNIAEQPYRIFVIVATFVASVAMIL